MQFSQETTGSPSTRTRRKILTSPPSTLSSPPAKKPRFPAPPSKSREVPTTTSGKEKVEAGSNERPSPVSPVASGDFEAGTLDEELLAWAEKNVSEASVADYLRGLPVPEYKGKLLRLPQNWNVREDSILSDPVVAFQVINLRS